MGFLVYDWGAFCFLEWRDEALVTVVLESALMLACCVTLGQSLLWGP